MQTKTKVNFTNENGVRFEYYSCMKGTCATRSIDRMFKSNKKEGADSHFETAPDFAISDDIKALFA